MKKIKEQQENTEEKSSSGINPEDKSAGGSQHTEINNQQSAVGSQQENTTPPPLSAEEELRLKYEELNDKHIRLYSEFENFKKRTVKERLELFKSAGEGIISALLPVLDDFQRHSDNESDDIMALKEAVKLIHNKFKNTLVQNGLEDMDSMNKMFDTDLHDALSNAPSPSKKLKGKVIDVVEKGYFLNGKVIRHAKVIVGN